MPKFYFNIKDGEELPDEFGTELPDMAAARKEAVHVAAQFIRDRADDALWSGTPWQLDVTDRPSWAGRKLLILTFIASVVPAPGDNPSKAA